MSGSTPLFDVGRFARLLTLIAVVTTVSLLTSASVLPSEVQSVGFVAIGSVALVTAMLSFMIAAAAVLDEPM